MSQHYDYYVTSDGKVYYMTTTTSNISTFDDISLGENNTSTTNQLTINFSDTEESQLSIVSPADTPSQYWVFLRTFSSDLKEGFEKAGVEIKQLIEELEIKQHVDKNLEAFRSEDGTWCIESKISYYK